MALFGRKKKQEPEVVEEAPPEVLPDPPAPNSDGLRPMAAHRDYLLSLVDELPPFGQQVLDALDLSLCEDVVAEIDLPTFDNSAMDGYAVIAEDVAGATEDVPVTLPVVGEIAAGQAASHQLSPGTAMKIMTGAPMPEGADTVIAYGQTDRGDDDVRVLRAPTPGQHVRHRGEDIEAGTTVLREGDQLKPRSIGLLAGIGRDKILVRPRPRVVVISTGTELVEPGLKLNPTEQLYDSNSYMLAAAAKETGAQVFRVGLVSDDPDEVREAISDQLIRADLILTTGGVSQGDYDVVKAVMPELGLTDFTEVAMQPGRPQGFGLIGEDKIPIIMLPGNPVSAFVSFEAFARPVIRKLMGAFPYERPVVRCVAAHSMTSTLGRLQLARGIVEIDAIGRRKLNLVGGNAASLIGDLARCNALALLPEDVEFIRGGEEVEAWLLGDGL